MPSVTNKLRPKVGFSYLLHLALNALLPILVFIFVRINFAQIALALILLSKWRMFAVRPRYWLANIRTNGVDIIVGLSILVFMLHTGSAFWQLVWAIVYMLWLVVLKPGSDTLRVAAQAIVCQSLGLVAVFIWLSPSPNYQIIIATWVVCYLSARHFFTIFEERFTSLYSHTWGYFAAALSWILAHWLLYYGALSQPMVLLTIIGAGVGALYYLEHNEVLSSGLKRQIILVTAAAVIVVLVFSNWSSKIV
ncbi:MAG TPA: hypothetical protein VMR34_03805 [Candidatus Saccharimonadales bacterium]|nr:hypothetical protein [Candidatus Saccharimonadales bacterium]